MSSSPNSVGQPASPLASPSDAHSYKDVARRWSGHVARAPRSFFGRVCGTVRKYVSGATASQYFFCSYAAPTVA
ncbi:hypothetical protein ABZV31_19165 [Streptomyces sp. NPDC005202]|uniref:hypothetical protein n=1 Tax=Streptomyces sp. NPDC005202 TaxID=3157021 RepID=UPI0033A8FB28